MKQKKQREPASAWDLPARDCFGGWMGTQVRNGLAALAGFGALAVVLLAAAIVRSAWPLLVAGSAGLLGLRGYRRHGVWLHALWVASLFLMIGGLVWLLFWFAQR
ncbi:MAG: hypothetical protein IPL40_09945 [Proteobacteria bacterium]|nr:hypothetical protein [Pseudomonadota bacterium]